MNFEDTQNALTQYEIPSVSFGYTTVHIYGGNRLSEAQVGYAIDPSGDSLVDGSVGSWQPQWLVIGYEDLCGDPIFIDTESKGFAVYTAIHGRGVWEPSLIASTLEGFAAAMRAVYSISTGRQNPNELEANPLSLSERVDVLNTIARYNEGVDLEFWEDWITQD